jgi:ABC-type polysaccharide/polyol phosphate export permease
MPSPKGFRLEGDTTPVGTLVRDLVRSRDLVGVLARQNFYVQYRRAAFGLLWSVLLPLFQATVLGIVLLKVTDLGRGRGGGTDFVTFIFAGTTAWSFLSSSVQSGATSIVGGAGMTTKVYFPRSVLPIVAVFTNIYGFVTSTAVLLIMCLVTGVSLGPNLLLLPVAMILAVVITSAFTLVLAALHVYFRDVRYIVTAITQPWFYCTPIFYSLDLVGSARRFIEANPMTGVVLLFRRATVGSTEPIFVALCWTLAWIVVLLIAAGLLYRRYERLFADLL